MMDIPRKDALAPSKALFLQDLQLGELPDTVDGVDVELGLIAVFAFVDVAPVTDGTSRQA